jgi:hypothetical protein
MWTPFSRGQPRMRLGCGYLLMATLLTCVLLAINGLIVINLVNAVMPALPRTWRQPRLMQALMFLTPLALLVLEWWVCDVTLDWLRPTRARPPRRTDPSGGMLS